MTDGKKQLAERIFHNSLAIIESKVEDEEPISIFHKALKNARPLLEVKSRRVGGSTYQVPIEVKKERSVALAMNWIISNSRAKKGRPMQEKLAQEIMDAANGVGITI